MSEKQTKISKKKVERQPFEADWKKRTLDERIFLLKNAIHNHDERFALVFDLISKCTKQVEDVGIDNIKPMTLSKTTDLKDLKKDIEAVYKWAGYLDRKISLHDKEYHAVYTKQWDRIQSLQATISGIQVFLGVVCLGVIIGTIYYFSEIL